MPKKKTKKEKEEDKFIFLTELGDKYAKELTEKITPEEQIVKKLLKECKIKFEFQKKFIDSIKYANNLSQFYIEHKSFELTQDLINNLSELKHLQSIFIKTDLALKKNISFERFKQVIKHFGGLNMKLIKTKVK